MQLNTFKKELDRLVEIGVLEKQGRSAWQSGTFIIPKKDKHVCWISDFRALNKAIIHRNYPIPKIQDILSRRSGYKCLTKLDLVGAYSPAVVQQQNGNHQSRMCDDASVKDIEDRQLETRGQQERAGKHSNKLTRLSQR